MFVTAKHDNPGLKRDACALWIEDVTTSHCKVCLRELQNYAGAHEDIYVVSLTHELRDDQILNVLGVTRAKVATYKFIVRKSSLSSTPQLFRSWIALSTGEIAIQWMNLRETNCATLLYQEHNKDCCCCCCCCCCIWWIPGIHLLNNWG